MLKLFLFIGISFLYQFALSQDLDRPKIGLVLSGGGAKGFAHIGAIKLLEEVGIKPDYITGTSMGSIVGALYAMGYTPDEIIEISDTTDWEIVLSNSVPLDQITVSEKPYYGTFWTELNVTKSGISLPEGLIEGQNLLEKLSELSRPVHGIDNFLAYPIPFACIATDIVNGKPVALKSGNIVDAIRASMAIPTVFTPVEIDTLLLIDGGWTRNLPVQEALDMGADIIISIDVGAPLSKKEDLGNMLAIMDQTAWILSARDTEKQLELSDYVISPPVRGFSTFDFGKIDSIIAFGYSEAAKQRSEFEALAKRIYPTGKNEHIIVKPINQDSYVISAVSVIGNKLTSKKFVVGRININSNRSYSSHEISEKISNLYGSLYYKKIKYELISNGNHTTELRIIVTENNPAQLKLSMYYDTENSVGFNLNFTLRNIVLRNSRLIFDAFVSENPIVGLKYIKYVGQDQRAIIYTDGKYTKDSRYQWQNLYLSPAGFNYREVYGKAGVAYTLKNKWIIGQEFGYLGAKISPTTNPDTLIQSWKQSSLPLNTYIKLNTFDQAVFPNKGMRFSLNAIYNFKVKHRAILQSDFTEETQTVIDEIVYVSPHFLFKFNYQQYIQIASAFSLIVDARIHFSSQNRVGFNDYAKIGGISPVLYSSSSFWGATRSEINVRQAATLTFGFQWEFVKKLYLIGKINYLDTEYPMAWIVPGNEVSTFNIDGQNRSQMLGFGAEISYASPIGPIRFVLHQNQYSKNLNLFIAVGFNIHRSKGTF